MAKVTYRLEKVDGRCYFNDGAKHVLIDTGYGWSVSCDGMIGPFKVEGCDLDQLQTFNPTIMHNGRKIGAILFPPNGFSCLLEGDTVTIDNDAEELPEHEWFLPFVGGRPHLECAVDGKKKLLYCDSGMRLPVVDDASLVAGKERLGVIAEWIGIMHGLAEAPYYEASFDFPCGFHFDGHLEHDYLHAYISRLFGGTGVNGYLGIEFFNKYDLFISAIRGKEGLAIIKRSIS